MGCEGCEDPNACLFWRCLASASDPSTTFAATGQDAIEDGRWLDQKSLKMVDLNDDQLGFDGFLMGFDVCLMGFYRF